MYYQSPNCISFQYIVYHYTFGPLKESKGEKTQSSALGAFILTHTFIGLLIPT